VATTADPQEVEQLRARVSLYLGVMLIIDVGSYLSDVVTPLFLDDLKYPEMPPGFTLLRWAVTVSLAALWLLTRFARPGRLALGALESGVTLGLVWVYIHLALTYTSPVLPAYGPAFAMFGILLLLSVRASLVPSPVVRTAVIGITSVVSLLVLANPSLRALDPVVTDGLTFIGGAFVVATSVTSHVIYGLRRQVRHAMRLGQYELGRKLGEGGMGVVYEATHLMLRRPTAVKLLPIDRVGEQTVARFEREVRQTSRLEHPNSVAIYDYGRTPDGQFYYAMEYLDGVTLAQLVEMDGPVGVARAGLILRQAANALAEAHALGLVHRDVKPANIMLCERARIPDTVKVLDFGLVKAIADPGIDENITQANAVVGTPHYLAPEAISSPDEVGPASDVYALGAIGFFLVTGREVFTGQSVVEVCAKHLKDAPESPSAVSGVAIDPGFETLILRCLEKRPDDRPRDGAALADEIEQLQLEGWTLDDARAWWRALPGRREGARDFTPLERTQLAVDVEGRR
jgi:serine/threonine-protein kinase